MFCRAVLSLFFWCLNVGLLMIFDIWAAPLVASTLPPSRQPGAARAAIQLDQWPADRRPGRAKTSRPDSRTKAGGVFGGGGMCLAIMYP